MSFWFSKNTSGMFAAIDYAGLCNKDSRNLLWVNASHKWPSTHSFLNLTCLLLVRSPTSVFFFHDRFRWKILQIHIKYFTALNLTPYAYQELMHFLELEAITLHFLWFTFRLYFLHCSKRIFSCFSRPTGVWEINEYWIFSLKKRTVTQMLKTFGAWKLCQISQWYHINGC